jgi:hypothetical protein
MILNISIYFLNIYDQKYDLWSIRSMILNISIYFLDICEQK